MRMPHGEDTRCQTLRVPRVSHLIPPPSGDLLRPGERRHTYNRSKPPSTTHGLPSFMPSCFGTSQLPLSQHADIHVSEDQFIGVAQLLPVALLVRVDRLHDEWDREKAGSQSASSRQDDDDAGGSGTDLWMPWWAPAASLFSEQLAYASFPGQPPCSCVQPAWDFRFPSM